MREIKLRAYHKKWKKMLLVKSISWIHGGGVHLGDFGSKEVYQLEPMKDVILMQSTGLKDKNGKEIYEGHVLKYPDSKIIEVVGWKENMWTEEGYMTGFGEFTFTLDQYEIIGNIHENPGLLDK